MKRTTLNLINCFLIVFLAESISCANRQRFPKSFSNLLIDEINFNKSLDDSQAKILKKERDKFLIGNAPEILDEIPARDASMILHIYGDQLVFFPGDGWSYYTVGFRGVSLWELKSKFWLEFSEICLAASRTGDTTALLLYLDKLKTQNLNENANSRDPRKRSFS
jgi:hypothetical protein